MAAEEKPADDAVVYETDEGTPLPRSFLVEASGPATVIRDHGNVVERCDVELTISHDITTLEEFGKWWTFRDVRFPKKKAISRLLTEQATDGVGYTVDADQREAWEVQIDGHVRAFFAVGETIVGFDDGLAEFEAPSQQFEERVRNPLEKDADDLVADFAMDLKSCDLWGPGIRLAELAVEHAQRNDLESYVEALLEEVEN